MVGVFAGVVLSQLRQLLSSWLLCHQESCNLPAGHGELTQSSATGMSVKLGSLLSSICPEWHIMGTVGVLARVLLIQLRQLLNDLDSCHVLRRPIIIWVCNGFLLPQVDGSIPRPASQEPTDH